LFKKNVLDSCDFQSKDYISLKTNFKDFTNNLDSKTFVEFEENNSKVYSLQSRSNGDIFGNIIFSKNDKGVYVSVVELYNRNSNGKIISFDYKNVNNENLFTFNSKQIENNTYSLKLNKESFTSSYSILNRSWWDCTRDCISDAWGPVAEKLNVILSAQ